MADARGVQFVRAVIVVGAGVAFVAVVPFGFYAPVGAFLEPAGTDATNPLIKFTAFPVVLMWAFGWPIALAPRSTAPRGLARPSRVVWTFGCVFLLLHIATAFHAGHGWSHRAAWEHTRAAGGYGDGIFVNYLFAVVWLADVVWAWVAFGSYLARPNWVKWVVHGFLAFVVFNAAVVFGTGLGRFAYLALFLLVAAFVWLGRSRTDTGAPTANRHE